MDSGQIVLDEFDCSFLCSVKLLGMKQPTWTILKATSLDMFGLILYFMAG